MRIISGKLKGRRFYPPADKWPTRPTTDISKEGLYNILQHSLDFESINMLDLFGGTGNHCYEFISRGCKSVTYVDRHRPCVKFVESLAKELEIESFIKIVKADVFKFINKTVDKYDFIFAGPPYPLKKIPEIPQLIFDHNLLKGGGTLVLEHNQDHQFNNHFGFEQVRKYGGTFFSFFKKK
ncbi:RsmD family RNA methyltransferase [Membranihabitans maritimus]|uniref:RsmD family RNA methyltransferase n=1 Tax=Membranihabitans maritimus TaxID=2904244 RepID=UPI001F2D314B|nr:RsmD family RNA methyltransferase [Membranihabitans maritimus]